MTYIIELIGKGYYVGGGVAQAEFHEVELAHHFDEKLDAEMYIDLLHKHYPNMGTFGIKEVYKGKELTLGG